MCFAIYETYMRHRQNWIIYFYCFHFWVLKLGIFVLPSAPTSIIITQFFYRADIIKLNTRTSAPSDEHYPLPYI